MRTEVQQEIERVICEYLKDSRFGIEAESRGLEAKYVANQISAFVGELCDKYPDLVYLSEKLENAKRQTVNVLSSESVQSWKFHGKG